ncbi:MAG: DNA polymerase III subunit delta' [Acidimicrobiia bacterium]|nr:MAG: DNA polymerase III subunit delta' [Acidimicrobiia bacterium]
MTHFAGFVGHGSVLDLLESELRNPSQAYLFVGPSNVGKASVARRFAAALVGGDNGDAVGRANTGSHPDLVLIAPEGRSSITVDQARGVVSSAVRSPLEAGRKVFLFEEASMLNDEAANALLKTIEEPIATTVFVLVAESEHDLPTTVSSRCRSIVFGRVPEHDIVTGLVELGIDPDEALNAARISGGRPGLAVALAREPLVASFRDAWISIPSELSDQPGDAYRITASVMEATEPLLDAVKQRQDAELQRNHPEGNIPKFVSERQQRELARATDALYVTGLELLATFYRDTAAAQLGAPVQNTDIPVSSLTRVTTETAVRNAFRVLDTIDSLNANQRPSLALAALFLDLGTDV